MSDLERNLRDVLARRASAAPPSQGDWQDLTVRMARRNRRTKRVMAGALALVLIVGPLAGFAVARSIDDGDSSDQVSAGGPAISANMLALSGQGSGTSTLERLFRRTTSDDIQIRGYLSPVNSVCEGTMCPLTACVPDAQIIGQLSTEAAVGYAIGGRFAKAAPDIKVTGAGFFGANGEGSPVEWIIAQASDRVAKVRMTFLDGATDEMAPVQGAVILAAPSDPAKTGGTLEAFDAGGTLVGHAPIPVLAMLSGQASSSGTLHRVEGSSSSSDGSTNSFSIEDSSSASSGSGSSRASSSVSGSSSSSSSAGTTPSDPCDAAAGPAPAAPTPTTTPPSLPSPGAQPADPAAARLEIERAFTTSYDGGVGDSPEKQAVVEDPTVLAHALEQINQGPYAGHVADSDAKVNDVVFTSPTEATVRYEIDIVNYTSFTGRIGQAKLIDGRWKITRATTCNDIALSGVHCAAP
jgi:hypothetical protein